MEKLVNDTRKSKNGRLCGGFKRLPNRKLGFNKTTCYRKTVTIFFSAFFPSSSSASTMSASENATNMNDARLKPPMLRNLVRENLPDENEPSRIPLELSEIISLIETHKLLSESLGDSTDKKFVESWKSAVDKWVDRLTKLISSSLVHINSFNVFVYIYKYIVYFQYARVQRFQSVVALCSFIALIAIDKVKLSFLFYFSFCLLLNLGMDLHSAYE